MENRTLVVGLQYGDEGKGRVSHILARDHDWSIRFNGGPNAGHTVYQDDKKFKLHHLPGGVVLGKKIALDAGMVIDLEILSKECQTVGVKPEEIWISENAHIIQSSHRAADSEGSGVGSTRKGIAYAYADRALKKGVRFDQYQGSLGYNVYQGLPPLAPGESALFESAQGIMLDVDYGAYPWTTSSSVFPSAVHKINRRVGVLKAYTSRVGSGPPNYPDLPWLSDKGDEFGTTTGRKRKCYWLILDEIKYALSIYQPDEIVVTKLDILQDVEIKIWNDDKETVIGSLDSYKDFLLETFPSITHFSESPKGPLVDVSR